MLGSEVRIGQGTLTALPTRDAILPMLVLLTTAAKLSVPLSRLQKNLPSRFTASDRIQNVPVIVSQKLLDSLVDDMAAASELMAPVAGEVVGQDLTDGLRLVFANGDVVHLRASGNAPELRCYAESDTQKSANILASVCLQRVKNLLTATNAVLNSAKRIS